MPLTKSDFNLLAKGNGSWLQTNHFQKHIDAVVFHLNNSSPIAGLQRCRKAVLNKGGADDTFKSYKRLLVGEFKRLKQYSNHWYHYSEGGMDEMQFNFGMYPEYYRIGIGFSFSGYENADVAKTIKHCRAFQAKVNSDRKTFENIIANLKLSAPPPI